MAKFYGIVGYSDTIQKEPGIWVDGIVEKKYKGDLLQNYGKTESSGNVNDNINISNRVSILSNPYAAENFLNIKYVKFIIPKLGGIWKVTNVEVAYPRLILTIGGVYNGDTA